MWAQKNEYGKAIRDCDEAIRLDSKSRAWNNKAWLLATCPDEKFRDGKQAIEVATKACELTAWENYVQLDTLAAAHAEAGDFEQAVKWQEKVVSLLPPAERADSESRLKLYREGKPYRELPKTNPAADAPAPGLRRR